MKNFLFPPQSLFTRLLLQAATRPFLFFYLLAGLSTRQPAFGQIDTTNSITRQFNRYSQQTWPEKLFLHLDRPLYVAGETMWFKIYAVDGTFHQPLPLSKIAYVEVLDKEQKPVLQGKIAIRAATGQGSFVLPTTLASGNYQVRAYTNWMKNFSPDYFFQSPVTVVNTLTNLGVKPGQDSVAYSVQFFPEGGNLVKDLVSTVAFKVSDKAGRGLAAEGSIRDQQGNVITTFKTQQLGFGRFTLTPTATEKYTATVKLADNTTIMQALPAVCEQGYVMHLEDISPEQLKITVSANPVGQTAEDLFLLGHARQKIAVAAGSRLNNNGQAEFIINKKDLAEGISHFTVFNARQQPLCERLYFQLPQHRLVITAAPDKNTYTTREKVSIQLATTNLLKEVAPANLSLAVYRLDSLPTPEMPAINSYLWLSSDLRGYIQNLEYYFTANNPEVAETRDNLMLTQGWRRFRWEKVFASKPDSLTYIPELNGHFITGRITNRATGQPMPRMATYLASPSRHVRLYNSVSQENGVIRFEVKDFYGPREIVVQPGTGQDSLYRFKIASPFSPQYAVQPVPPFTLSEKFKIDIEQRHVQMQVQNSYFKKHNAAFTAPLTDSLAFYGQPDEKYNLDDYTRFKVMEEVMREYVPGVQVRIRKDGFHFMVFDNVNKSIFQNNPLVLLDGVPVFNLNKLMAMDPLKIQKLEVITSRYFQGTLSYEGLVSFSTYQGDLEGYELNPNTFIQDYEGLQLQREFYAPRYETAAEKQSRLPDLRNLLYWAPQVNSGAAGSSTLQFYTADKPGKYQVVIQGLSSRGLAGSTSFTFDVKPSL